LARNLGLLQANDLSISIIAPTLAVPFNVSLTGQVGTEHFSIYVTLSRNEASPNGPKLPEGNREPRKPERDTESDAYGENGERMPYHPARPRQLRTGELARDAFDRDARGPVS
jgi:hypothetical protein